MRAGGEFGRYVRGIVRRFWLVVLLAALGAGAFYWTASSQAPKYTSAVTLMVTTQTLFNVPTTTVTQGNGQGGSVVKSDTNVMNSIIQLLSSRPIAEGVASAVGGGVRPAEILKALQATKVPGTNLIALRATTGDRELSAKIANAAAQQFISYFQEANRKDAHDVRLFIEQQLSESRQRIETLDRSVESYKVRTGIASLDDTINQAAQDLTDIHKDQSGTQVHLQATEARLSAAARRLAQQPYTRVTIQDIESNPVFQQLEAALTELQLRRADYEQRYTAAHPKMIELAGQIAAVRRQLTQQTRKILGKQETQVNPIYDHLLQEIVDLEVDRAADTATLRTLAVLERRKRAALLQIPEVERTLTGLLRDRAVLQENYSTLSARYLEALLRENEAGYVPAGVHIMDTAVPAGGSRPANLPVRTGMGLLIGLFLGLGAAVLLENSDDRIRSVQDAERTLGAPVLTRVPDITPRKPVPVGTVITIGVILSMLIGAAVAIRGQADLQTALATVHAVVQKAVR